MDLGTDLTLVAKACGAVAPLDFDESHVRDYLRDLTLCQDQDSFVAVLRYFCENPSRDYGFELGMYLRDFIDIGDPTGPEAQAAGRFLSEGQNQYMARGRFFMPFDLEACEAMVRIVFRLRRARWSPWDDWRGVVGRWCDYVRFRRLDLVAPPPLPSAPERRHHH